MKYTIWLINFGWYVNGGQTYKTFTEALEVGKKTGFECRIDREDGVLAAWSPLYGLHMYQVMENAS